jgi:hypothetical protein
MPTTSPFPSKEGVRSRPTVSACKKRASWSLEGEGDGSKTEGEGSKTEGEVEKKGRLEADLPAPGSVLGIARYPGRKDERR